GRRSGEVEVLAEAERVRKRHRADRDAGGERGGEREEAVLELARQRGRQADAEVAGEVELAAGVVEDLRVRDAERDVAQEGVVFGQGRVEVEHLVPGEREAGGELEVLGE